MEWYLWKLGRLAWSRGGSTGTRTDVDGTWKHLVLGFWVLASLSKPQPNSPQRCTGATTDQMRSAPKGAVYVWGNTSLGYPSQLAKQIDRADLVIVSPEWLSSQSWRGRSFPGIVVDHAACLSPAQRRALVDASCSACRRVIPEFGR